MSQPKVYQTYHTLFDLDIDQLKAHIVASQNRGQLAAQHGKDSTAAHQYQERDKAAKVLGLRLAFDSDAWQHLTLP